MKKFKFMEEYKLVIKKIKPVLTYFSKRKAEKSCLYNAAPAVGKTHNNV